MDRTNLKIMAAGLLGLALFVPFQNCSDVGFDQVRRNSIEDQQDFEDFLTKRQTEVINSDNSKIDILFVVDNSVSMTKYQDNMASRITGFMNYVRGLDYRIAVTSTDVDRSNSYSDGKFRSFDPADPNFQILDQAGVPDPTEADARLGYAI